MIIRKLLMLGVLCHSWVAGAETVDPLAIPTVTKEQVICFALYTVHAGVLKLTAQLYPLAADDERTVHLELERSGQWQEVARCQVIESGWTAPFRVEPWDATQSVRYRVAHGASARYEGVIQRDPVEKQVITVAAFTGNSILPQHGGDIPKTDIVENLRRVKPDLLFFSGDQVYDHKRHYAAWLRFGRDFGDIIRDTPTVCIPDDHDVGQSNLWGAEGRQSTFEHGNDGGFFQTAAYVNEVQRAQTSHLPDPYDPTPVLRNIGVYYTDLTWGRIGFAILEDRKWKSGPTGWTPPPGKRVDHLMDPDYDPASVDAPGAELLGERQLTFLRTWGEDWTGTDMKAVLSQTIFCGGAHLHGERDYRVIGDMDSNGWPQSGRNRALEEIRKSFSVMIAGDQHLGTVMHHGTDNWNDSGYSFCVPSIANLYLRWWAPLEPGKNRAPGMPDYLGEFLDGFGNRLTMLAVANPSVAENHDKLTTRAAGFGLVKFDKHTREITLECWPRNVDISQPGAKPYPGWPIRIRQEDNYSRAAAGWLPTLQFTGEPNPVVRVVDEINGKTVYTLRCRGNRFAPKVFHEGMYTVHAGEGAQTRTLTGLQTYPQPDTHNIEIGL